MKRLITLLLALVLAFTVTGCKKKPAETSTPETTSSSNTQSDNNSSDNESTSTDNTNTEPSSIDNNTALNSNTSSINNSPLSQNNSASENTSSQNSEKDNTNSDNESTSSDNTNTEPSNTNDNSSTDNTSSDTQNTSSDVSSETPPDNENEYKNISCRNVGNDEWKTADVSVNGNNQFYVNLSIPSDWEINDDIIKRNGLQIGVISEKLVDTSAATYEKSEKNDSNDTSVLIRSSVEKYEINGTSQFKRFFKVTKFSDKNGTNICIYVDYAELDDAASNKLYNSILTVNYTKSE
ncbi:MAG: hypothetical protein U0L36_05880 [Acutalibacteraceae bacterium]|nr:hypothetical protein [Acutalibacteraceae bacterium]